MLFGIDYIHFAEKARDILENLLQFVIFEWKFKNNKTIINII